MPGPPHEEHHGPPHGGPPGGRFLVNDERRRELAQIGGFLETVGSELETGGATEIGGETIEPASTPVFVVRYERMPGGELKLLFELEWNPRETAKPRAATGDVVSEKTSARTDRLRRNSGAIEPKLSNDGK